jgi:hypothetical protein
MLAEGISVVKFNEGGDWRVALEDFMTKPEVGLPWDLLGAGWFR